MPNERRRATTGSHRPVTVLYPSALAKARGETNPPIVPGDPALARLVICELSANGELDSHAAMCLQFTIHDLLAQGATEIVLDVRDLSAVDQDAIELLQQEQRICSASGAQLELLIDSRGAHGEVTHALQRAGLAVTPHLSPQRPTTRPRRRSRHAFNPDSHGPATSET